MTNDIYRMDRSNMNAIYGMRTSKLDGEMLTSYATFAVFL